MKQLSFRSLLFPTLFWAMIIPTVQSCTKENSTSITQTTELSSSDHTIPLEQALETLQGYLNTIPTKSDACSRTIGDIYTVGGKAVATRSGSNQTGNVLYIVNFEGNNGYAVLPADDRILDDMLALVDEGYITDEEFSSQLAAEHRLNYEYYPQTGDGYFTATVDGETEYFMNPNTFQLYDDSAADCFVGNFSNDIACSDSLAAEDSLIAEMPVKLSQLILDYADQCISNYVVVNLDTADVNAPMLEDSVFTDSPAPNPSNHVFKTEIEVLRDDIEGVGNLLEDLSSWHQEFPFNSFCPNVRRFILFGEEKQAYCGCVNLAVGKILTYFQYPDVLIFNNHRVEWDKLVPELDWMNGGMTSAGILMSCLGTMCNSLYFFEGTFTFPTYAVALLRNMGYNNVVYDDYDTETVIEALDNGCPVFICSIPNPGFLNYDLAKSHAWNIDGYMSKRKSIITRQYLDGVLMNSTRTNHDTVLVHCDWGWGGNSNGYFVSGIFNKRYTDINMESVETLKTNYNWYLKTITYEAPNE